MPYSFLRSFFLMGSLLIAGSSLCGSVAQAQNPEKGSPQEWVGENLDSLVNLYKHFHSHPELSFLEVQTSARLAEELKQAGFEVTTGFAKTGVAAILKNGAGPTVMVRADMDALPVTEATNLPYASKVQTKDRKGNDVGVMHACGHDVHITCLVGVARYMATHKDRWKGTLLLIGQPAEEVGGGAAAMLDDGLFKKLPKPDYALALHSDAFMLTGQIGYRAGYALANVDSVDIVFKGKGGHGAYPQTTIDPIVMAAHFIVDVQSVVSRENSPFDPAVITVGAIKAGTKHNIISDTCHLQLTVRSYDEKVRKKLHDGIRRKANAAAASAGAPEPSLEFSDYTPAMKNDDRLVERLLPVIASVVGRENTIGVEQSMGGEDFSQFQLAGVPIFMFRLGTIDPQRKEEWTKGGKAMPSLHSPFYYPDPPATLKTGVSVMSTALLDLLYPVKK